MPRPVDSSIAARLHARIETLAGISDEAGQLTRSFLSPAMREATALFARWCRDARLDTTIDAVGNVRARWRPLGPAGGRRPFIALGSHLDTVRNAGRFDGALGALSALACVEHAQAACVVPPFDLEVVGFADEEGLRFQTAYLGSGYYAGAFSEKWLSLVDADGRSLAQALADFGSDPNAVVARQAAPADLAGYLELHIEQGPILEERDRAIGVVSAIAAQTRASLGFTGKAGHAGTTPMESRQDAFCAAAEAALFMEKLARDTPSLRATSGQVRVEPGASNVIPSNARISVDIRHPEDAILAKAIADLKAGVQAIASRRRVSTQWETLQQSQAVPMDAAFQSAFMAAARECQKTHGNGENDVPVLVSGAGHDAVILSRICPVGMLFVRCRDGLSHHPDEYAAPEDIDTALGALTGAVEALRKGSLRN